MVTVIVCVKEMTQESTEAYVESVYCSLKLNEFGNFLQKHTKLKIAAFQGSINQIILERKDRLVHMLELCALGYIVY